VIYWLTMRHPWRFLLGLILGVVISVAGACERTVVTSPPSAPETAVPSEATDMSASKPAALPPKTADIVASAGPEGLYNPPRGDVRLVVISDLNGIYGSTDYDPEVDKAMALLPFWQPDMVVCSGDMVAGQDISLPEERLQAMWAAFDEHIAAPLRQANLPYGFTIGNHDASSAQGVGNTFLFQKERDIAAAYWSDPAHDPGVNFIDRFEFPFYYTFTFNDIFFLAWDGSSHHIPEEKLAWVEQALASEAAQQAKLRILLGHLPLYAVAVGRNEPAEVMDNADALREMLEKYGVHTYISGHHHAYYPAHKHGMQLLHMGILGSGPRPLIDGDLPPWKALTVLDIRFDSSQVTTYTTYNMQTLELIEMEQLPRFLTGHNGMVLRRDVEMEDLSASERRSCQQTLGESLCRA